MKIGTLLLGILAILLLWEIAEKICCRSKWYKNKYIKRYFEMGKFFEPIPSGIEVCNVGSGPSVHSVSYEGFPGQCFNFGTAPQNITNGFRLLKNFADKMAANAIVFIFICPFSFGNNKDEQRVDYQDKFYCFMKPKYIENFSWKKHFWIWHPLLQSIVLGCKKKFAKPAAAPKTDLPPQKPTEPETEELPVIKGWKADFDLKNMTDPEETRKHDPTFAKNTEIMVEGIQFCQSRGWRPVIVLPPFPPMTTAYISDAFIEEFVYKNIRNALRQTGEIPVLDYYRDERFRDPTLFTGDAFVNEKGRKLLSELLRLEVIKYNS